MLFKSGIFLIKVTQGEWLKILTPLYPEKETTNKYISI